MSSPFLSIPPVPQVRSGIPTSSFAGIFPRPRSLRMRCTSQECLRPTWHCDRASYLHFHPAHTERKPGEQTHTHSQSLLHNTCHSSTFPAPMGPGSKSHTGIMALGIVISGSIAPETLVQHRILGVELENTESQAAQTRLGEERLQRRQGT